MRTPRRVLAIALLCAACGGAPPPDAAEEALSAPRPPAATIVLMHGWGGFLRSGELTYFWGVPELYRSLGAQVVIPQISPVNTIEARARQVKAQLDEVPGPLILLAHSQGGLDARYLVSKLGYASRVRAVVTIATPHHGTQVADVVAGLTPAPVRVAVDELLEPLHWSVDEMIELSTPYMERTFNRTVLDAPGVTYWSWSGRATPFGLGKDNGVVHASLVPGWTLLDAFHAPSDGVVPEASAHWGDYQGVLKADHLTEINQPHGAHAHFDAIGFYRSLLGRFHDQGW